MTRIGLNGADQPVETDYRAEFRRLFEKSFVSWIKASARADACGHRRYNDDEVAAIIKDAGNAFYPGLFLRSKRNKFRAELKREAQLARSLGRTMALDNCLMAGQLAEISLSPVREAIRSAGRLD